MEHINQEQLNSILELDFKEMNILVIDLFESINISIKELKSYCLTQSLVEQNSEKITFLAHALKGETLNFGFSSLSKLYAKLEDELLEKDDVLGVVLSLVEIKNITEKEYTTYCLNLKSEND